MPARLQRRAAHSAGESARSYCCSGAAESSHVSVHAFAACACILTPPAQPAHLRAARAGRERGQAAGAGGAVVRDRVGGADAARARPAREREPRGAGRRHARRGAHWGAAGLHAAAPRPDRRAHGHLCAAHCGDSGGTALACTHAHIYVLY